MNKHTVMIVLEAKPEKNIELKQALIDVIKPSRTEKGCLEYRLHQDVNNINQFILYENWESKEAHQEQFQKPYIINLANQMDGLLAKPYQVFFAHEIEY